jgi:hypothetical protein
MHNKIYDSKRPYTIKYFGYANIYNIGNNDSFYIKIDVFNSLVPTIDNMEIFVVKRQTNMKSTIYGSL